MTQQTPAQIKARHIESMGAELGELFYLLKQDIFQLCVQWNEYVDAFGTNEKRINLLNRAAGGFARSVQDALWADVLLGLTRLTDPPKSVGKSNLTVTRLTSLLEGDLRALLEERVGAAVESTRFARDWRNRYFAHRDLQHAIDADALPLEAASRLKVRNALDAIVAVMNTVEAHFEKFTTSYSEARHLNGAVNLLHVLHDGILFDQERRARLEAGTPLPSDYAPKDL